MTVIQTLTESEPDKWVIIEMNDTGDGEVEFKFAPRTLQIPADWTGNIIWYVYTPGWQLSTIEDEPAIRFVTPGFDAVPTADPTRQNCWTVLADDVRGSFHYTVTVHREDDPTTKLYSTDPVVENPPPPPTP
jgi:hypothetical protein